jgi:lipopolysaccharide/colanic/teichoic acid biosynthesis glycosyltransferase/multisubunit Na+/H+ antiporter MnhB subunit
MNNLSVDMALAKASVRPSVAPRPLSRVRYQLLLGLVIAVVVPSVVYHIDHLALAVQRSSSLNTAIGSAVAYILSLYLFRRVATFPGVGLIGFVMPAVTTGYGILLTIFFAARLDYSRFNFFISFVAAICFLFLVSINIRRHGRQRFYIIPSEHASGLVALGGVEWTVLSEPRLPNDPSAILIADLRADLDDDWERLVAEAALRGYPVYHSKQVQESLTGRVAIEHLSENSFGSLIPNLSYRKLKRAIDLTLALALLPLFIVPGLLIALSIKFDSPGPVFFRQLRRGYRGEVFHVLKFRTMQHDSSTLSESARDNAITQTGDPRITRMGYFLRRTRIDELPQIWNIVRGEMSWIGPRPEAIALSEWYMAELPFYTYRHVVRPGITGWAQVNQGHVADLDGVHEKLHYDFFYIKNFSAWLDLLIAWRTIGIVLSGFGAK